MKNILINIITIFLLSSAVSYAQSTFLIDQSSSSIKVEGTSTLHDWAISVDSFEGNIEGSEFSTKPSIIGGQLICDVNSFHSGKNPMDKNMYKAMKEKEYPQLSLRYLKTNSIIQYGVNHTIKAIGELTIAGVTKEILLTIEGSFLNNQFHVEGSNTFKMSEYGVVPPSFMFGTVNTGDEVTIHYKINFKIINN